MLSPKVRAVLVKELRDALRDRRTILASVILPVMLYPILLLGMSEVVLLARAKLEREVYTVAVPAGTLSFFQGLSTPAQYDAPPKPPVLADEEDEMGTAAASPPVPTLAFKEMEPEEAKAALAAGEVRLIVDVPSDWERQLNAKEPTPIPVEVQLDRAEHRSQDAAQRLATLLDQKGKLIMEERLKARDLTPRALRAFEIKNVNVAQASKVGGMVIGSLLPVLFIVIVLTGAMYPAIDMTAGEKERSTLETLIGAPVRPVEIIAGKFLAVATLALGNAALNVVSFTLTFLLLPLPKLTELVFPWSVLPLTLLLLIPLTLFFAGLLVAVASFASNQKEAQIYCLPVYLVPMLGMMVVNVPGIDLDGPLLLVPVLNTALLIKELFLGHGTLQQVLFVFCSTCLYAAGTVALAARIFAREEVLFSSQGSLRLLLNRRFFKWTDYPRAADSLLLIALLFPVNFYLQAAVQRALPRLTSGEGLGWSFAAMLALIIAVVFLGLPLLAAWYLKLNLRRTFLWRGFSARTGIAAVLLAFGAWPIAMELMAWQSHFWILPNIPDDPLMRSTQQLAHSGGGVALLLFVIAVTPGICEEHAFRGFLQQGVTRASKWFGIVLVAVIFAAFHIPVFRQPTVLLLGLLLGYIAYQTQSIWPGVITHTLVNATTVVGPTLLLKLGLKLEEQRPGEPMPGMPLPLLIPGLVAFAAGLALLPKRMDPVSLPAGNPTPAQGPLQGVTPGES